MNEDEVKKLYSALVGKGYKTSDIGDESQFTARMQDAGNRRALYDHVRKKGFKIGDYDAYEKRLTQDAGVAYTPQVGNPATDDMYYLNKNKEDALMKIGDTMREEDEIDKMFTPREVTREEDVYNNYRDRFALTREGQELTQRAAEAEQAAVKKYSDAFLQGEEAKSILADKRLSDKDKDDMLNNIFAMRYMQAIDDDMKPYNDEIAKATEKRYGKRMEADLYPLRKKGNAEQVQDLAGRIDTMIADKRKSIAASERDEDKGFTLENYDPRTGTYGHATDYTYNNRERGELTMLKQARRLMEQSQDVIDEAGKKGNTNFLAGTLRGVRDNLEARDFTFGLAEMVDMKQLNKVLTKADKGEELSEAEETLLDASVTNMATNYYYTNDLGRGYKAGQMTAESLPFMLEFMVNPISGSGNAIAKGLLKYGLKKWGRKAVEKGVKGRILSKGMKTGARLAGDAAAAAGMTATTGLPRVQADKYRRLNENYEYGFDDNGNVVVQKTGNLSEGDALKQAFASSFFENQSEMIFNAFKGFNPFMQAADKVLPGGVNEYFARLGKSKVGKLWRELKDNPTVREVAERAQFHGLPEEYMEEVYNNLTSVARGEMTVDELTDLDKNIDTFLGLAPTSVMFGAIGLGGMAKERYRNYKKMSKLYDGMTDEQKKRINELQKLSRREGNEDIRLFIDETLSDKTLTPEQKRAELEYCFELAKRDAIDEIATEQVDEQVEAETQSILDASDRQRGTYTEMSRYDIDPESGKTITVPGYRIGEINGQPVWIPADGSTSEGIVLKDNEYDPESVVSMPTQEVISETEAMMREDAAKRGQLEDEYDVSAMKPYGELQAGDSFNGAEGAIYTVHPQRGTHGELMVLKGVGGVIEGVQPMTEEDYIRMAAPREEAVSEPTAQEAPEERAYSLDETVTVRDENGNEVAGRIVSMPDADGKYQVETQSVVNGRRVHEFTREELDGMQPVEVQDRKEKYSLSEKKSGNGEPFYQDENGNIDLVQLPQEVFDEIGYTNAPFRLSPSMIAHMLGRHKQELGISSTDEAISFVLDVMNNFDHIRLGYDGALIFSIENGRKRVGKRAVTILINSDNGEFYGLKTSGYESVNGLNKRPMLWERGAKDVSSSTDAASASVPTGKSPLSGEQSGSASHQNTSLDEDKGSLSGGEKQGAEEEKVSAMDRIPTDEQGNPLYEQADSDTAWDAIVEQSAGDEEVAGEVIADLISEHEAKVKAAEKVLKKVQEAKPTRKVGSPVTIEERIAAKREAKENLLKAQAQVDKAKADLAAWQKIAETPNRRKAEAEAQQRRLAEAEAAKRKAAEERLRAEREEAERIEREALNGVPDAVTPVQDGVGGQASLLDVVRILYSKGKEAASKLFSMKFFDVATTPKFMKELGLRGDKFTIKYGVIARHIGKDGSHNLTEKDWEQLPQALQNPFAISKLTDKESSYRIYTTLQTASGEFAVVGVDVKNAGREIEVNAVSTVFGRRNNANLPKNEEVIYRSNEVTPEQSSLLKRPNFAQYPTEQELSEDKGSETSRNDKGLSEKIAAAEAETDTHPTDKQKEAGNYKKGHVQVGVFDITIEQPKGSVRSGVDANGNKWETTMQNTYGYIRGTEGVDGDHIDVFLSDDIDGWNGRRVFVVDQYNEDGSFDEHKVMLGFNETDDAEAAYFANYDNDWAKKHKTVVTGVNLEDFEKWIDSSHRKKKAFAEYKSVKADVAQKEQGVDKTVREQFGSYKKGDKFIDDGPFGSGKVLTLSEFTGSVNNPTAILYDDKGNVYKELYSNIGTLLLPINENKKNTRKKSVKAIEGKKEDVREQRASVSEEEKEIEPTPIGKSIFGNIYDQFKGKVKEAFDFLIMNKSGDLLGVFHRADVGDIDLVWGDKGGGLAHIIDKHVGKSKSFKNINEFIEEVTDVFKNGNIVFKDGDKIVFKKGSKLVTIRTNLRKKGKKIADKNWVLTAYDELSADGDVSAIAPINQGQAAQATDNSTHKDNSSGVKKQGFVDFLSEKEFREQMADGEQQSVSAADAALMDALTDKLRESGIEVVTDSEAAQRVLDEANGKARTMSFGEEYDYEQYPNGRVEPGLADKVVHVERAELDHGFANFDEAREWAKENIVRTLNNEESGGKGNVKISGTAVNKYLSESAVAKSDSKDIHLAVLKKLPDVIRESIDVETTPDFKKDENGERKAGNPINKDVLIHRCYGAVEIDGNIYRIKITLKEYKDAVRDNKAYSYEATKIELLAGTLVGGDKSSNPGTSNSLSAANLLKDVDMSYNPGVKVLEESENRSNGIREQRAYAGKSAEERSEIQYQKAKELLAALNDAGFRNFEISRSVTPFGVSTYIQGELGLKFRISDHGVNSYERILNEEHIDLDTPVGYVVGTAEKRKKEIDDSVSKKNAEQAAREEREARADEKWERIKDNFAGLVFKTLDHTYQDYETFSNKETTNRISGRKYPRSHVMQVATEVKHGSQAYRYEWAEPADANGQGVAMNRGSEKPSVEYIEAYDEENGQIRFFRTASGEAYGFTVDGKIYIDPKIATAETPIHEYAHLWADALRRMNPKEWENVVELMKGTPVWEEVKRMYPELKTDDAIADEVLAHYSGRRGAERLRAEQQAIANGEGSLADKVNAISALERVKESLKKFWKGVADWLGIRFTTAEEVADKVMADLLNGVNPIKHAKVNGNPRFQFVGEKGAANMDKAEEATVRMDNLAVAREMEEAFNEKKKRIEKLRKSEPVEITGKEIEPSDDLKQYKKNALEYGKRLQGSYTNKDTGRVIQLQRGRKNGGVNEVLQHDYKDVEHLQSIAAIPQIIENSIYIISRENVDVEKNPNVKEYQYYVCGLKIGDEDYTVRSTVAVEKDGNRYYDHKLTKIEKGILIDNLNGISKSVAENQNADNVGFGTTPGTKPTTENKDKVLLPILQINEQENARRIKMATGWERGADGKWRYEVMDFDVDVRGTARRNHLHDKLPWGKEYDALADKLFNGETLTAEEDARFEELSSLAQNLQETYEKAGTRYLDDYLKDSSLFEAYPELKQVRVEMYNDPRSFTGATWYGSLNLVRVNEAKLDTQELRSILLHEVQHAIQDIEGFARGGNVNSTELKDSEEYKQWKEMLERMRSATEKEQELYSSLNYYIAESEKLEEKIDNFFFGEYDARKDVPVMDAMKKGLEEMLSNIQSIMAEIESEQNNRGKKVQAMLDAEKSVLQRLYKRLAGEVEARNVQSRMDMTEEERRKTLAAETEDVAREDQIFLMENAGKADSLGDGFKTFNGEEAIEQLNAFFDIKPSDLPALPAPINSLDAFKEVFAEPVRTVLGTLIEVKDRVFEKIARREREMVSGSMLSTLKDADFVIKDTDGSKLYVKRYKNAENEHIYNVTIVNKRDEVEDYISSVHIKSNNNLRNKIEKGAELLLPSKRTRYGEQAPSNSTPATNVQQTSENASIAEEKYREGDGAYTDDEVSYENDPIAKVMGKPRGTARQRRAFADRERQRMAARVTSLAEKLHLDNVETVTDASTLEGKKQRAKGFYNKQTGKITIVIPNHASAHDVEQTLLHEAVAHYGLRQLFGEHFDTFLDNVFNHADEQVHKRITEKRRELYRQYVENATKGASSLAEKAELIANLPRQERDFTRTATEEYLASLAEETDFENLNASWWQRIKNFFIDMLHKIGFEDFGGVTLTDNELRYLLWRSYENLAEPGRYKSLAGETKDAMKQYELGVGDYAGSSLPTDGLVAEAGDLEEVNARFNAELEQQIDGILPKGHIYRLGMPGDVLQSAGLPDLPIELASIRLSDKSMQENHPFDLQEVKNLPEAIQRPLAVFRSATHIGSFVVMTEIEHKGKNFVVAIQTNKKKGRIEINDIRSVHYRTSNAHIANWISEGLLEYADKKRMAERLSKQRYNSADVRKLFNHAAKIVKEFENPTISGEKYEEDELYRDGDPVMYERRMARDIYEERLQKGMYQAQEAMQDSMLSVKEAMQAILGKRINIEDVSGFENAYIGENRLSSVNQAEAEAFARTVFNPLLDEVANLAKNDAQRAELTDYMMAKHGLERNRVMAERKAAAEARKEFANELSQAQKAVDKAPLDFLAANQLDDVKQRMHDREEELFIEYREKDFAGLTALTGKGSVAEAEAEAEQMVQDYEQIHGTQELWKRMRGVSRGILSKAYESGLMDEETYRDISSMYDYYIPLRGFDEKTSADVYAYMSHKESAFNAPIKTAKGRRSKADDPLAYLESMAESTIMQGNRNKLVKQRFLNFALNHPSDLVSVSELWLAYDEVADEWKPVFPDNIEETDTPEEVERKMQDFEAKMQTLAEQEPDKYKHGKDTAGIPYRVVEKKQERQHQVIVKRNGRDYVLTVNGNPRLAQALNGQTNPDNDLSGVLGYLSRTNEQVNRFLSAMYTTRNPDFVVSNFVRDMLYSNTMVWIKESPNYARLFNKHCATTANPANMKRLLGKYRNGKLDMSDKTEAMFYQFMMNGGETGYSNIRDIEKHKNDINTALKKANGRIPLKQALGYLGERLDEYNRAIENCARFSAFVTSREMGRTVDRAIYDAKEISVNFNKKGSGAKFVGKNGQTKFGNIAGATSGAGRTFQVFWNAAVQGMTNFGKQAKRHPKKMLTLASNVFLLGMLMAYLGDDDEDELGKNSYYNLPETTRRSSIVFRIGDYWATIPLPVEFRAIYGIGELLTSTLSGKVHLTNYELANQLAGQLSQLLPLDLVNTANFSAEGTTWRERGLNMAVSVLPTSVKAVGEVLINRSWTGMPIWKDSPYNKHMPEWTKAYKNANKQLVNLAATLNEWNGGDEFTPGAIDLNPAAIEYLLNAYLGGAYKTVDKMVKTAETIIGEREFNPQSILLVNRLVKQSDDRTQYRNVNNEYFRMKQEHDITKDRLRKYENSTNLGLADYSEKIYMMNHSPEFQRMLIFDEFQSDMNDLYTQLKEIPDKESQEILEEELYLLKKLMLEEMKPTWEKQASKEKKD